MNEFELLQLAIDIATKHGMHNQKLHGRRFGPDTGGGSGGDPVINREAFGGKLFRKGGKNRDTGLTEWEKDPEKRALMRSAGEEIGRLWNERENTGGSYRPPVGNDGVPDEVFEKYAQRRLYRDQYLEKLDKRREAIETARDAKDEKAILLSLADDPDLSVLRGKRLLPPDVPKITDTTSLAAAREKLRQSEKDLADKTKKYTAFSQRIKSAKKPPTDKAAEQYVESRYERWIAQRNTEALRRSIEEYEGRQK